LVKDLSVFSVPAYPLKVAGQELLAHAQQDLSDDYFFATARWLRGLGGSSTVQWANVPQKPRTLDDMEWMPVPDA